MKETEKINSLNGIRGFAILLVLFSHASNEGLNFYSTISFSGAGRYGVFLFFVLSAFLLTQQFLKAKLGYNELKAFTTHYFLRRFLRIFPLFTTALFAYYLLHKSGNSIYLIDGVMLLKTLFLLDAEGIFWTIPIEFQYYFLLPAVSILFIYVNKPAFIIISLLIFIAVWWHLFPPRYANHLLPFLPVFVLGSLAGFVSTIIQDYVACRTPLIWKFNILAIASASLFFALIPAFFNLLFDANIGRTTFHHEFLLFSLLSCSLIIFTIHGNGFITKTMENRILVFWGNISFSAYLFHMIVLVFVNRYGYMYPPEIRWLFFIILTAVFSFLSFKYIELPLSKYHTIKKAFGIFNKNEKQL